MSSRGPTRLGKYDLIARIAKGGMAEIYLARQQGAQGFSRLVVVKRILPHLAEEPQFVRMFLEEARIAALVNHPNVVQIFDVDQHQGDYYIAMEFIEGPSVSSVAKRHRVRHRPVPYPVAAEIICQVCAGLHAAHELRDDNGSLLNLVHRDISPHNLMVAEAGLVKLVDFGIAKAKDSSIKTRTGSIKGKYPYMSPEQCVGDPLDRRTDIFSLGTVFFELSTGHRLFHRPTELMTLKAISEEPIARAREFAPDLPREMEQIISIALQRRREDRFPTAEAMGQALRQALRELQFRTSVSTVATFLKGEHGDLLKKRAESVKQAVQMARKSHGVPEMEGLQSGTHPPSRGRGSESAGDLARAQTTARSGASTVSKKVVLLSLTVILLATAGGLLVRFWGQAGRPDGPALRFGLTPSFPEKVVLEEMAPLVAYVEKRTGRRMESVVAPDYDSLRRDLASGRVAFAHLPPLQYVLARHNTPEIKALVSHLYEETRVYQALLIARDDSGIGTLADLKGRTFCYVDPGSTSGYVLARYHLRQNGIDPDQDLGRTVFSGNHVAVLKDILAGKCDAGAVYSGAMIAANNLGLPGSRLFRLSVSGLLPHEVICAAPDVPPEVAAAVRRALLEMDPQRDLGRKLLGKTLRISGFAHIEDEEFAEVEAAAHAEGLLK